MFRKIFISLLITCIASVAFSQTPQPIRQLLNASYMQGATFTFVAKDVQSGEVLYEHDSKREVTPASVLKTVTTATAIELLGEDFRFATTLQYDGYIEEGILYGNLYIKGSGDPTLGSSHFAPRQSHQISDRNEFISDWVAALREAGIRKITGSVISDESLFDTEGIAPKWVWEDMGSYFGAASYGLNVFDNIVRINLSTGSAGQRPTIKTTVPAIPDLKFHNYLTTAQIATDSSYVIGAPFNMDRYLYGTVPASKTNYALRGDIPDPALFLARYLHKSLEESGISIDGTYTCHRIMAEEGRWNPGERQTLTTTYSPTLSQIIAIANQKSHNLYTDALLKTVGLSYTPTKGEVISSFGKGIKVVKKYWEDKGLSVSNLQMYDGSGLSVTDKVTAEFITDLLVYMATRSESSTAYFNSLPQCGVEGSVRNFLRGSSLQGRSRLKSGGMSRVRCYAGYIERDGKQYAIALFANNYNCEGREITRALEKMLVALF